MRAFWTTRTRIRPGAPGPAYCDEPEKSEVPPRAGAASPSGSSSSRDGSCAVARSASVDLAHNL